MPGDFGNAIDETGDADDVSQGWLVAPTLCIRLFGGRVADVNCPAPQLYVQPKPDSDLARLQMPLQIFMYPPTGLWKYMLRKTAGKIFPYYAALLSGGFSHHHTSGHSAHPHNRGD